MNNLVNNQHDTNRRNFIKSIIRNFLLLGLAFTSIFLVFKEDDGEECNFDFVCRSCKKSKGCSLPEAKNYRSNKLRV
ncbi:MAG: hypothetical protein P1P88_00105 [Bacteroidales bacterium]|nr:hypothetical protein [Bacteroidales bacterium]